MTAQVQQQKKPHFNSRVANQFAQQLHDGESPLQRRGVQDIPYNPSNGRTFHGINALTLMMQGRKDGRWMTFDEASQSGYKVKAGEKGTPVIYWPPKKPGETENRAITTYVYNGEQIDRIPPMPRKPARPDPLERVTDMLKNSGMNIVHDQAERSFYAPRKDEIHLPKPENRASAEKYCEAAIYEYFKASGHPSRLNRDSFSAVASADRAKEELVCGVATMMLCAEIGIPHDPNRNPDLALGWAKSMEHHPLEFAKAMEQADNAVWVTLRQEHTRNAVLNPGEKEVWRPVPDASPSVAVGTFVQMNATLDLSRNQPEAVHAFDYREQEIFAMPETGKILSKQSTGRDGTGAEMEVKVKTEAYDRQGNTYDVIMQYTGLRNDKGQFELTSPAQALSVAPAQKNMSLPLDWNGTVEVRGCAEDREGNTVSGLTNPDEIQFHGVYANNKDGTQAHMADFDTREQAERYAGLVNKEYERQTGRGDAQTAERQQAAAQAIPAQERPAASQAQDREKTDRKVSARDECIAAMKSVGMIVTGDHPVFDGKPHRIAVDGDKKNEQSGFYVAHSDGRPSGYVKNNRSGEEQRWSAKGYILDENQKKALHQQAKDTVAKRDGELQAEHDKTAKRLEGNMKRFTVPAEQTPYLKAKGVQLHPGVFANGNSTCIPLHNIKGEVRSMAYIQEDGTKRYAKNSEKEGCFHTIGGMGALKKATAIIIAEGYATAATISESTGRPTVAAFDAGNLMHVAKALRAAFPDKPIVIAGDNDAKLEADKGQNPGKNHAIQAAKAVNGVAVFPRFTDKESQSKQFTDFNDLARKHGDLGKEAVKSQIQPAIDKLIKENANTQEKEAAQEKSRSDKELARA